MQSALIKQALIKQKDYADSILKLQAGFRLDYAEEKHSPQPHLFHVQLDTVIEEHVRDLQQLSNQLRGYFRLEEHVI